MIYFSSDLHFGHNKNFLYEPRGFNSIEEHDEQIIKNWNEIITDEDDVYILGDLMLNDNESGIEKLKQLKGKIHIILGNHDSAVRQEIYKTLFDEVLYATMIKVGKQYYFLTHYPSITSNYDDRPYHSHVINLSRSYAF